MDKRVQQIRDILDELAKIDGSDNDAKEIIYDRELGKIRSIDRENIIDVIRQAVGNNPKRKRFAPYVFSELYDVPGIEDVFSDLLESADEIGRSDIIQTIGLKKMRTLVGVLNHHFYRETDNFCRERILSSLGRIADETSLPIFCKLMKERDPRLVWLILVAAHQFARPEFHDYLNDVFTDPLTKISDKVLSAWGLAKLGNRDAYEYLILMLNDPEIKTANSYDPGHSMRAAQALADINGWTFDWDKSSVPLVKARVKEQR